MICPKCRKKYKNNVTECPECGLQLIALMGEADAPTDDDFDNISNIDVVFAKGEQQSAEEISETQENTFEIAFDAEPDVNNENNFAFENNDDKIKLETLDESVDTFKSIIENSEEKIVFIEQEEIDIQSKTEDDANKQENSVLLDLKDEVYENSVDDEDEDVKIFVSSYDDFVVKDVNNTDDSDEAAYNEKSSLSYDDEYEVNFDKSEDEEAYEYDKENVDNMLNEVHIGKATIYKANSSVSKTSAAAKRAKSEKETIVISEKSTNIITMFIFVIAVLMIIAGVVCFALGNTTELVEIEINKSLSSFINYIM